MKNKLHYSFNEEEKALFIETVLQQIHANYDINSYDVVLMPDTKNECFKQIAEKLNIPKVVFKKNNKEYVLEKLAEQKMMKDERKKLFDNINAMEDVKIGLVAANQRMRVAKLLFNINTNLEGKKILFIDDSVFTGSTFKAISEVVNIKEAFVLFSNAE